MDLTDKRNLSHFPSGGRILVDSNILIYHLLDYPTFGPICEKFLQGILDKRYQGFITPIIASETLFNFIKAYILKVYGAKGRDATTLIKHDPDILQEIPLDLPREIFEIFGILHCGAEEVNTAIDYASRYALLPNDALNAATMKANGIDSIATNDSDFKAIPDINILSLF